MLDLCIFFPGKYQPVKDLSIGGVVMLENTSGEPETIVEPMIVNKVTIITRVSLTRHFVR
jgi:hypothetical protein